MTSDKSPERIRAAPKIRRIYWCDLPADVQIPEFTKTRPVLVISRKSRLYGKVTVLPLSTQAQRNPGVSVMITSPFGPGKSWIVCDHPMTIAVSRLKLPNAGIPRLPPDTFASVMLRFLGTFAIPEY